MDLILEFQNSLTDDFCDEIIRKFEEDERKEKSKVSNVSNKSFIDFNYRKSTELKISEYSDWEDIHTKLFTIISEKLSEYYSFLKKCGYEKNEIILGLIGSSHIKGLSITKSEKSDYFNWHIDDYDGKGRFITVLIYLNTLNESEGGSTVFGNGKIIKPEKGKIVFFPSLWTHVHRGDVVKNNSKYIVSGFFCR